MTDQNASAAVVTREYGAGRVVAFNHAGNYNGYSTLSNQNSIRLYLNALAYVTNAIASPPGVITTPGSSIGTGTATLNGTANPNGLATDARFRYGTDSSLTTGTDTALQAVGSGSSPVAFSQPITGLSAHTLYYFRATATSSAGTDNGSILSFTTDNTPPTAPDASTTATTGDLTAYTVIFPSPDADGDTVTLVSVIPGAHLTVNSWAGNVVNFTPDSNYVGTSTLSYIVIDGWGGTAIGTITVTITDNDAPTAICQNVTVILDASGNGSTTAAAVNNGSSDNIGIASLSLSPTSPFFDPTAITCANVGSNPVTLIVTDAAGNTSTCNATVTVVDNIPPVAVCQNVTVILDASGNGTTTPAAVDNGSSDACGPPSLSLSRTTFGCADVGPVSVTLTVTDVNGNISTCSATVTVVDNLPPILTCPAPVTVQCGSNVPAPAPGSLIVSDNCSSPPPVVTHVLPDVVSSGTTPCDYVLTRTYRAVDNHGNSTTCTQLITVKDTLAPVVTPPTNRTVEYGRSTLPAATGTATALDNCSGARPVTYTDVVVESDNACNLGTQVVKIITRTWRATDLCNNTATAVQTITVKDTIRPMFTINPTSYIVACGSSLVPVPFNDSAPEGTTRITMLNDGLAPIPQYTTNPSDPYPILTYADTVTPGACAGNYTITRVWTAVDEGCNTSTWTQTITVSDTARPTLRAPPVATVPYGASPDVTPAVTGWPTATDACDASLTLTYTDSTGVQVGDCNQNYDITRTWTATDDCGNFHTGQQTIQVRAPMPWITTHPVSTTTTLGGPATFTVAVSDACGVRYQWLRNSLAISGAINSSYTVVSANPLDNGAQYRCQVTRDVTSVLSNAATLTLTVPLPIPAALPPLLTMTPPPPGGEDIVVSFPTEPGFLYHLQGRPSMDVDEWINLGDEITGTGGLIEVDVPVESVPSGVFRLMVVPYLESP